MNDLPLSALAAARDVMVVTSTFGDGEPPDNGADFFERLHAPDAPGLHHLRYAILGIGDRAYENFCGHAKSIDSRLAALGATPLLDRVDCEAYDDERMSRWADEVWTLLDALDAPAGHGARGGVATLTRPRRAPARAPAQFTRTKPLPAPLCRNTLLTPSAAGKEVRQFGFDISQYEVDYCAGDSLGVYVTNSDADVQAWLTATGLRGDEAVEVDGTAQTLREALTRCYDICRVTPDLLRFVAGTDRAAAKLLRARSAERDRWLVNRNGLDVVREFAVHAEPQQWQEVLIRLTPRQYSISCSPLVSPHEVQLTVSVVRYRGSDGGRRGGVASTFLADRTATAPVPVFLQRAPHFRPPPDGATPMIMVGPGTGVAPFRGFLQDRRARGHTGRNWLFFGDRHRHENFYYRDDFEDMLADGLLSRLDLAFSRDQPQRVHVQHKMLDHGAEVWRWLQDGAHLYVCGDASRMAKDVDAALTTIIKTQGGMSDEGAKEYKKELVAAKRYVRDVY